MKRISETFIIPKFPCSLVELIQFIQLKINGFVPEEFKKSAMVYIDCDENCDSILSIYYDRPYTEIEKEEINRYQEAAKLRDFKKQEEQSIKFFTKYPDRLRYFLDNNRCVK